MLLDETSCVIDASETTFLVIAAHTQERVTNDGGNNMKVTKHKSTRMLSVN